VVATQEEPLRFTTTLARRCGEERICLAGELSLEDCGTIWRALREAAEERPPGGRLDIDVTDVVSVDGAVVALLVSFRASLFDRGCRSAIVGASGQVKSLVALYHGYDLPRSSPARAPRGLVERIGDATLVVVGGVRRLLTFLGDLVIAAIGVVWRPITGNWGAVFQLAETAGADGVPVVVILNFLVGFVMGLQSARQLVTYGANVYVADVVGISITRELGPLVTAIVMIGRSGAAFAAEIGTMKVSEELDALRTMGLSPPRYLVLPRIAALVIVAPLLTLLGDVVGVAAGAVVGALSLDVSPRAYLAELRVAVFARDVVGGLVKSVFFGIAIALIGCQQGLAAEGGATGVGRRTTATVVISLLTVVIIDALFALLLRILGK
jgi:phospholipid/cholesterol/gamma-HCH transport system permease protein